jgi:group I intron endonuclease
MTMFYVYHHINKETCEIFYVGQGMNNRAYSKRSRSNFWHNIVNKYDYEVLIIEKDLTADEANEREMYWIAKIGRRDLGLGTLVNLTNGGDSIRGYVFTEDDKIKMRKAHAGESNSFFGKKHSDEARKKMSEAKLGKPSHMKGKELSEEAKQKLREANLGKKHTEETKKKMSESHKGKYVKGHPQSEETRRKISESTSGENNKKRKEVIQLDMNGNVIKEWMSVSLASKSLGIGHIDQVCRGERNHAGGFRWIYKQTINL